MRKLALAACGTAAYLVFLAALTPASFAVEHGARPANVQLDRPQGTLWSGSARATIGVPGSAVVIDRIEWRFVPWQLLVGRMAFDLHATSAALEARARLTHGVGGLGASDISARGDAALLAAVFPIAAAWRPVGAVTLQSPRLAWNEGEILGDATAEWRGASASMPDARALGSYHAELHGSGGPARLTVATLEGGYVVRAEGTVTPQRLEVKGQAGGQDFALRLP